MDRVRVLHVITGLGVGGAETWLYRLLSRLEPGRFSCEVASLTDGGPMAGRIRELGVPVLELGMSRGVPDPAGLFRLVMAVRRFRPQVVQTWLYHADLLGFLALRLSGRRAALSWGLRCAYMDFSRYGVGTRLTVRALAVLSGRPEAVTANSRAGAEHHLALGYRPRKLVVLENGVDGARFRPDAEAGLLARRAWGIAPDAPVAGLVARVDAMKGHALFCEAAARVLAHLPGARFVFCGEGTEPGGDAGFEELLRRHGLLAAAVRLGRREDLPAVYPALDVLGLSSAGEGFPNVLAEALACGVPCVSLDVGDARRILGVPAGAAHGPGGVLAPAGDAQALAGGLAAVLGLEPGNRAALGAAGREHVLREFSLDTAVGRWAAHFEALAQGR